MLPAFIASQFKKPTGLLGIFTSYLMMKSNREKYNRVINDLDLQPHDKLLEIGYGLGMGIQMVAKRCSTCTIHGIDFSRLMYEKASYYNKRYIDSGRVQLQYGDFLKTSVLHTDYDKVFCLNVVHFWEELDNPFRKVSSLLKKGGAFHIYMLDKNTLMNKKVPDSVVKKHSIDQVLEALKSAGFQNVEYYSEKGLYIKAKK
jgi:cyclopropane fatty-acyl-phospholipid synthase-like methyltransferase